MSPLLQQFLSEARDFLQGISEKLMELEKEPENTSLLTELFRFVHTLKGNSGLFEFPEMTRVLHAGEDLLDAVRHGKVAYSQELADRLLDATDFVAMLCDDLESAGTIGSNYAAESSRLAESLRRLNVDLNRGASNGQREAQFEGLDSAISSENGRFSVPTFSLSDSHIPDAIREQALRLLNEGQSLHGVVYSPAEDCFFQGEDPFFQARNTPELFWGGIVAREPWPILTEMDAYRCLLDFHLLSTAAYTALEDHYRYMADRVSIKALSAADLVMRSSGGAVATDGEACANEPRYSEMAMAILATQREILTLPIGEDWQIGRLKAAVATASGCLRAVGAHDRIALLDAALEQSLAQGNTRPLLACLDNWMVDASAASIGLSNQYGAEVTHDAMPAVKSPSGASPTAEPDNETRFGRRAEDAIASAKSLKVDQVKIDRLMDLIGEMVVAKNALPYLAGRAETVFGVRELSREIKTQYAVINRIVEAMQDAIMQVRLLPVSFVFQRFPRLVRDTSRKLGKEVNLILEGEDTEADKNIIEALSDPLVHIVRNSLDHGFELPDVRRAAGKPAIGTLIIRAMQESDRVVIEIIDDGKGIDPAIVKRKAFEKGILDEAGLERISDQEAVNLIFAPGFSTAEVISDLSGRGVGMDVVRTAIEHVNGTLSLESEKGKGTRIRLGLPLSMAVTHVMIVESDGQQFGIPMDSVLETVRVPRAAIRSIKQSPATVLRDRIVPLKSINELLNIPAAQKTNQDDESAILVVRLGDDPVGLVVDNFHESTDIILKPMTGLMAQIKAYAGSALMGDGSVLMVLNLKELLL